MLGKSWWQCLFSLSVHSLFVCLSVSTSIIFPVVFSVAFVSFRVFVLAFVLCFSNFVLFCCLYFVYVFVNVRLRQVRECFMLVDTSVLACILVVHSWVMSFHSVLGVFAIWL